MGIPGLLKLLKPYTEAVHIKKYAGKRVGIDAYCWLHKGAYACSFDLCEQKSPDPKAIQPCIKYCMHHINMLKFNGIAPVVVFDGGRLPSKALTEDERQRRREANLEQARLKLSEGDTRGAEEMYQRSVEITPLMAYEFIKALKTELVEFVVAPYEADAQLAYLSKRSPEKGGISAVISEDSDLLAYGCNVVIYKMDRYGNGEEVNLTKIMKTNRSNLNGGEKSIWFGCFTQQLFTGMCILAGCDFVASVPGIGIKRAYGLVCKYRDLSRVLSSMRFDRKLVVPEGYELAFKQANAIFHHARVYDGSCRRLSFLEPLPARLSEEFNGDMDFLGPDLPPSRAIAIAEGRLDPISMCAFDEFPRERRLSCQVEKTHDINSGSVKLGIHQSDLWVDEGRAFLTAEDDKENLGVELSKDIQHSKVKTDKAFLTHLNKVAARTSLLCASDELGSCTLDGSSRSVEENCLSRSPGKKRVSAPLPNNNPFKKVKLDHNAIKLEDASSLLVNDLFRKSKMENTCLQLQEKRLKSLFSINPRIGASSSVELLDSGRPVFDLMIPSEFSQEMGADMLDPYALWVPPSLCRCFKRKQSIEDARISLFVGETYGLTCSSTTDELNMLQPCPIKDWASQHTNVSITNEKGLDMNVGSSSALGLAMGTPEKILGKHHNSSPSTILRKREISASAGKGSVKQTKKDAKVVRSAGLLKFFGRIST